MLEVEELRAGYGHSDVIHGISLSVERGEFVSILGSNGAGKTTFLKAVSGLLPISSGRASYAGIDVRRARPDQLVRRGMAHVPENRHLFPELTVRENLVVGAISKPAKVAAANIERVLDRVPLLKGLAGRNAGYLSGGEQQFLAIARALVSDPELILLDEPTLGLAPKAADQVEQLLHELNDADGVTILAVEQNVHSALRLAHTAYVIENGAIALSGEAKSLWADEEVIRAYIGV